MAFLCASMRTIGAIATLQGAMPTPRLSVSQLYVYNPNTPQILTIDSSPRLHDQAGFGDGRDGEYGQGPTPHEGRETAVWLSATRKGARLTVAARQYGASAGSNPDDYATGIDNPKP